MDNSPIYNEMDKLINKLTNWLNKERPNLKPYTWSWKPKRYYRIIDSNQGAYCFIAKEDFENKTVGKVKAGDILMASTYTQPAKHARGNLFDQTSWESAFGPWGVKYILEGRWLI